MSNLNNSPKKKQGWFRTAGGWVGNIFGFYDHPENKQTKPQNKRTPNKVVSRVLPRSTTRILKNKPRISQLQYRQPLTSPKRRYLRTPQKIDVEELLSPNNQFSKTRSRTKKIINDKQNVKNSKRKKRNRRKLHHKKIKMEHTSQELQSTSNLLPNFFSLPNNDLKKKLKTGITLKEYKEAASLLNYSFEIGERKRKSQRNKKKIKKSKKSQTKGEKEEKKEKKRRRTNKKKSSQKKKNSTLVGSTKKNHNSPRRKRSRKNKNTKKPITKKSLNTPKDQINSTKMDYFKLNLSKDNKPRSILKQKQKPPVESTEIKQEKSNFFNFGKKVKGGPIKNIESFGKRKKKTESQTQKKKYHFGVPKNEKEIPKIRENENENENENVNKNKNKKENENEIINKNFNNKQKNLKSEIKKKEIPPKTQPKKGSLEKGSQNEKTFQPTFEANSRSYSRKNKIVFDPIMPIKKNNNPFTIKNSRRRKKRRNKQKRSLFNIQNITYNNDFFGSKADSVLNTNPFFSMSHQKKIEIDLTKPHKFSSKFD